MCIRDRLQAHGVNIVIYANQLTRSAFPAMQKTATDILTYHRAKEIDDRLMPIKEIITCLLYTSITQMKSAKIKNGQGHVFQLIEPYLPIPFLELRTREIDTVNDYGIYRDFSV